jgi:hypothetical protein
MTAAEVQAWLAARRPAPPPALAARVAAAVAAGGDLPGGLPEHLAALGDRLLEQVAARPEGGRELALDLLAADALVTYAFEAQAETDVAGLAALAARVARGGGA